jgi:hypothetical protein
LHLRPVAGDAGLREAHGAKPTRPRPPARQPGSTPRRPLYPSRNKISAQPRPPRSMRRGRRPSRRGAAPRARRASNRPHLPQQPLLQALQGDHLPRDRHLARRKGAQLGLERAAQRLGAREAGAQGLGALRAVGLRRGLRWVGAGAAGAPRAPGAAGKQPGGFKAPWPAAAAARGAAPRRIPRAGCVVLGPSPRRRRPPGPRSRAAAARKSCPEIRGALASPLTVRPPADQKSAGTSAAGRLSLLSVRTDVYHRLGTRLAGDAARAAVWIGASMADAQSASANAAPGRRTPICEPASLFLLARGAG